MVYKTLFAILISNVTCGSGVTDHITSIEVHKMNDIYSLLPVPVYCDNLEKLGGEIDTIEIFDTQRISYIQSQLEEGDSAPLGYDDVDARAKLIIKYKSGKKDTACLGTTTLFQYNGKMMQLESGALVDMLDSLSK